AVEMLGFLATRMGYRNDGLMKNGSFQITRPWFLSLERDLLSGHENVNTRDNTAILVRSGCKVDERLGFVTAVESPEQQGLGNNNNDIKSRQLRLAKGGPETKVTQTFREAAAKLVQADYFSCEQWERGGFDADIETFGSHRSSIRLVSVCEPRDSTATRYRNWNFSRHPVYEQRRASLYS
ncbi:hypothetical protein BaRGS_00015635, partial [Batillaria attramentaria]